MCAGFGWFWGAHNVPQQDMKADFLGSCQHPQISPAAVHKLGPAHRASRVNGGIYESTDPWNTTWLFRKPQQSTFQELDTPCYGKLSTIRKPICREMLKQLKEEWSEQNQNVWLMYKGSELFDKSSKPFPNLLLLLSGSITECLIFIHSHSFILFAQVMHTPEGPEGM